MMLWRSISFRLSVYYAAIFFLSVSFLLAICFLIGVMIPAEALRDEIRTESEHFAEIARSQGLAKLRDALEVRQHREGDRFPFHALIAVDGTEVTSNLPSWPARGGSGWIRIEADLHVDGQEEDREALVLDRRLDNGARLLLGRDVEDLDDLEEQIGSAAALFLPVSLALAVIGGALIGRSVGRRIGTLVTATRAIEANNLSARIPLAGKNDDIDHLAGAMNQMLAKLDAALEGLRRTSDSVAHELRTPLARLHAHLEEMHRSRPSRAGLVKALDEVQRLGSLFDATLAVARIGSGRTDLPRTIVDLSTILRDATEMYGGPAEDRGVILTEAIPSDLHVHGHADLLFQAVCNLLDNAIKYTDPGGTVSVDARPSAEEVVITVTDEGPGVPEEFHDLIFERFYRTPSSEHVPGLGMGLAFFAAVNALHKAKVSLTAAGPRGLRIEWRVPRFSSIDPQE